MFICFFFFNFLFMSLWNGRNGKFDWETYRYFYSFFLVYVRWVRSAFLLLRASVKKNVKYRNDVFCAVCVLWRCWYKMLWNFGTVSMIGLDFGVWMTVVVRIISWDFFFFWVIHSPVTGVFKIGLFNFGAQFSLLIDFTWILNFFFVFLYFL